MTLLTVPIAADTLDQARQLIAEAKRQGAEMIELRLDLLPAGAADVLPPLARVPVLATCRDRAEGGQFDGDDVARAELLCRAAAAGARYVDFELAAWQRSGRARERLTSALGPAARCDLILSAHDFTGKPADLAERIDALWSSPAQVAKIAYAAHRITDCPAALDVVHLSAGRKPTIGLAMGEAGVMTRLIARKLGAFCTFAALDAGKGTAPGQPTLAQFKTLYRWDRVGPATALFGVIGWPVAHSMSPACHNAAFDATGCDGLYVPLAVDPDAAVFDALLDGLLERNAWLNFRGLSVTIPHKENALRFLRRRRGQVEPLAERIGAINTIRFESDGSLSGRNTDYAAALDAVCAGLGCERAGLAGRSVAVLGAGGAARAVVAGFVDAAAVVSVFNRTASRAEQLAGEFGCRARAFDDPRIADADVIVNATSVGMHPDVDRSPLADSAIRVGQLVFDTIYNPVQTRLLRQGQARGARTVNGVEMFVRQAAAQFEWWTARPAPADVIRHVLMERLGG